MPVLNLWLCIKLATKRSLAVHEPPVPFRSQKFPKKPLYNRKLWRFRRLSWSAQRRRLCVTKWQPCCWERKYWLSETGWMRGLTERAARGSFAASPWARHLRTSPCFSHRLSLNWFGLRCTGVVWRFLAIHTAHAITGLLKTQLSRSISILQYCNLKP